MELFQKSIGVVSIFILLILSVFLLSTFSNGLLPESDRYAYGYTTLSNNSANEFNISQNASYAYDLLSFSIISSETPDKTLIVSIDNTNTSSKTVNVYLNSVSIGSFLAAGSSNTSHTFNNVNWIESNQNNVTYQVI